MTGVMRRCLAVLAVAASVLSGCLGDIEILRRGEEPSAPEEKSSEGDDSFALAVEQPQLLPFNVRLGRLAAVVGVPTTDPVFELVRRNRTSLGDHDFANGQQPDRLWTASRMSLWVRSVKPVCASKAMRDRYPKLPEDLGALIENAFGRPATDEDRAIVNDALATATELDEATRYQTACLALLSSAEFVVQ